MDRGEQKENLLRKSRKKSEQKQKQELRELESMGELDG